MTTHNCTFCGFSADSEEKLLRHYATDHPAHYAQHYAVKDFWSNGTFSAVRLDSYDDLKTMTTPAPHTILFGDRKVCPAEEWVVLSSLENWRGPGWYYLYEYDRPSRGDLKSVAVVLPVEVLLNRLGAELVEIASSMDSLREAMGQEKEFTHDQATSQG